MRMWMVDPQVMCRKHLLGEHVELHMLAGHLARNRSIAGFVRNNCVQPSSIGRRHAALSLEMSRRGYRHASPLKQPTAHAHNKVRVDQVLAQAELIRRCPDCLARYANLQRSIERLIAAD